MVCGTTPYLTGLLKIFLKQSTHFLVSVHQRQVVESVGYTVAVVLSHASLAVVLWVFLQKLEILPLPN